MAKTYYEYQTSSGLVVNCILLNSVEDWPIPEGSGLLEQVPAARNQWVWDGADWQLQDVPDQYGQIGDTWDGTKFIAPASPKPAPVIEAAQPAAENVQAL